eukprot:TRINITY_DN5394_c0_g2_i4.p2 TRINITY_DN5394_c0_g2~~TRINITY_DN5394_c0_g2_i4.p2  ORF type:complete len:270 (+),score=-17.77 TRINITY_DN5394_c0_g2_i4:601-1410(+)
MHLRKSTIQTYTLQCTSPKFAWVFTSTQINNISTNPIKYCTPNFQINRTAEFKKKTYDFLVAQLKQYNILTINILYMQQCQYLKHTKNLTTNIDLQHIAQVQLIKEVNQSSKNQQFFTKNITEQRNADKKIYNNKHERTLKIRKINYNYNQILKRVKINQPPCKKNILINTTRNLHKQPQLTQKIKALIFSNQMQNFHPEKQNNKNNKIGWTQFKGAPTIRNNYKLVKNYLEYNNKTNVNNKILIYIYSRLSSLFQTLVNSNFPLIRIF